LQLTNGSTSLFESDKIDLKDDLAVIAVIDDDRQICDTLCEGVAATYL
jgi:hypothetical protein